MILFHNDFAINNVSNQNVRFFCYVLNNIGFPMKGKLIRTLSVLVCMRFRIHRHVAAPKIVPNFASINSSFKKVFSRGLLRTATPRQIILLILYLIFLKRNLSFLQIDTCDIYLKIIKDIVLKKHCLLSITFYLGFKITLNIL